MTIITHSISCACKAWQGNVNITAHGAEKTIKIYNNINCSYSIYVYIYTQTDGEKKRDASVRLDLSYSMWCVRQSKCASGNVTLIPVLLNLCLCNFLSGENKEV